MRKIVTVVLTLLFSINFYAQVKFEKGYFINNVNERTECLIKNNDWKNNPTTFDYRLDDNTEVESANINSIKEFGIYNISKYVRATVLMDRASSNRMHLSNTKNPTFNEEQLFLNLLVEGQANLYSYEEGKLERFFYTINGSDLEQLVFKEYLTIDYKLGENNHYKQQLFTDLKCPSIPQKRIENLDYKKSQLINIFTEYNNCVTSDYQNFKKGEKKDLFSLSVRPRLNLSSFETDIAISGASSQELGSKTGIALGIEAEYVLPFNNGKWAVAIEPTYQYFKNQNVSEQNNISGGTLLIEVDYKSIEIPISLRHYFFLNNKSKIFVNLSYIFDITLDSSIEFIRADGSKYEVLDLNSGNNLAVGVGFKYDNKYSVEARIQSDRDLLTKYPTLSSSYSTFSFILGYSLF